MLDFTVAIPTYNGEDRLGEVLERLRSQINTENLSWEIIVVDNNSTDNTAQVIQEYQANWHQAYPLKYYFEVEQGAAFARLRAIEKARGRFIGFLDDDTLPTFNWVAEAYAFGRAHPKVGAYGSQVHADFEVNPPENFKRIACFLAITERGSKAHRYEPYQRMLPPSAGLVVRKHAWCESVPTRPFLSGRTTQSMLTSEDTEIIAHIQTAGWEVWYNPNMQISHKIPSGRLKKDYLISLIRGVGLARHYIRIIRMQAWQRPLAFPFYLVNDLRKIILHFIKYRKVIKSDLVAACEMQFLLTSLISPFYLWRKRYLDAKSKELKLEERTKSSTIAEPNILTVKL